MALFTRISAVLKEVEKRHGYCPVSFSFDAQEGLIIVSTELVGPSGSAILRLALDTGATSTLVNAGMLTALGYDPTLSLLTACPIFDTYIQ